MSKEIHIILHSILNKKEMEDIQIQSEDMYYCCNKMINSRTMHGLQLNNQPKSDEVLKICDDIADLIYKLRGVLDE